MNITFSGILFVLVIFQLLFLAFFLFTREKGKRISNLLLGFFFLSIACNLLDVFLLMTGFYFSYPFLAGWGNSLPLLFGPLLYFYTQSAIYMDFHLSRKKWLHFLPFLLFFVGTEGYYLFLPTAVQSALLHKLSGQHFPRAISLVSPLIFAQFVIYAALSLRLVSLYKKAANQHFSDRRHTDLSWLYFTLLFFIGIMLLATLNGLLAQTAAICEETGFRGYLQVPLEKKYGPAIAIVVTSLLFLLIHLSHTWAREIIPHIFLASVLLGILAYKTGSLIPGIIGHAILDIFDYSIWWTDLTGGFARQSIFRTGINLHFVVSSLAFLLALFVFFRAMRRLHPNRQPDCEKLS